MRRDIVRYWLTTLALTIVAGLLNAPASASGRQSSKPSPTNVQQGSKPSSKRPAKPKYRLRVTPETPQIISLRAKDAPLAEISADLARRLNVPVVLSEAMKKQHVTLAFKDFQLEAALRLLAPQVYIDYEISGDPSAQPKPLGIFLYGIDETQPPSSAVAQTNSVAIMVEGDTNDVASEAAAAEAKAKDPDSAAEQKDPISVSFENNLLSLRAHQQPLSVVLYQIAEKAGIPFDVRYDSPELVDADFSGLKLEEAVKRLSPNIRLYFRTDLQSSESKPLRVVLTAPAKS